MPQYEEPQWNVPGWDWAENDYTWLDAGIRKDNTSIFFIHGGRIRHQAHIRYGDYAIEDFVALIRKLAEGLDNPHVSWCEDTGGGDANLWVEGTRPPNEEDLERLRYARELQGRKDEQELRWLKRRRPDLFEKT